MLDALLLSFGDELALGQIVDTNAAWLAQQLSAHGLLAAEHRCIHDDRAAIARAFSEAAGRARVVVASGGLGPTEDDLTRAALADALGEELVEDAAAFEWIAAYFTGRGKPVPPQNRTQARRPHSASMLANACGTAPGLMARLGGAQVFVLPGVPREMRAMFAGEVAPRLPPAQAGAAFIATGMLHSFGMAESEMGERLRDLMARGRNPTVGTNVSGGQCAVRVRAVAADRQTAEQQVAQALDEAEKKLGKEFVFGRNGTSLAQAAIFRLQLEKATLATAESLTGGGLGAALTGVPGASDAYAGGFVTYTDALKTAILGVPEHLLRRHGAVSEPVACAMAEGALEKTGADYALSTTGIAGPGGGSEATPVGTVWIGLAKRGMPVLAKKFVFLGTREEVRERAVWAALQMLRNAP